MRYRLLLMRFALCAFIACSFALLTPLQAKAQQQSFQSQPLITAWTDYTKQAYAALQGPRNKTVNFTLLRQTYSQTRYYDPEGTQTLDQIDRLAMQIEMQTDPKAKQSLIKQFQAIFFKHLGHLGVVEHVYQLARLNPQLGDVTKLRWMVSGLLKAAKQSGDGASLSRPFVALTFAEIPAIVASLPLQNKTSLQGQESNVYYIAVKGVDPATRQQKFKYIDQSIPMRHVLSQEKQAKDKLQQLR